MKKLNFQSSTLEIGYTSKVLCYSYVVTNRFKQNKCMLIIVCDKYFELKKTRGAPMGRMNASHREVFAFEGQIDAHNVH